MVIAFGIDHPHHAIFDAHQGGIEGPTTKIKHQPVTVNGARLNAIGNRSRDGFLQQFNISEPSHFGGSLSRIELILPKHRRHRDHGSIDRLITDVAAQLAQHLRRKRLRSKVIGHVLAVIHPVSAHRAFELGKRIGWLQ